MTAFLWLCFFLGGLVCLAVLWALSRVTAPDDIGDTASDDSRVER